MFKNIIRPYILQSYKEFYGYTVDEVCSKLKINKRIYYKLINNEKVDSMTNLRIAEFLGIDPLSIIF